MIQKNKKLSRKKNVLIAPLDWGLGHATRCVPIINVLLKKDANVIIAADGRPLAFLKKEFPDLPVILFPGYGITYQKKGSFVLKISAALPQIFQGIYNEYKMLDETAKKYSIDLVISDNRFGLWNKNIPSIFITHQINIKSPFKSKYFDEMLFNFNKSFIKNYKECWIPDFEGEINLSGDLSHKYKLPIPSFYINPLSRFVKSEYKNINEDIDLMALISGPEPQRSIFEDMIISQLKEINLKAVIVRGTPEKKKSVRMNENITIFPHLSSDLLQDYLKRSKIVICRSGYSTIMDLAVMGKKAILVPTPGQTEQEYLADYYSEKNYFYSCEQKNFKLDEALEKSKSFSGILLDWDYKLLEERIDFWLSK